MYVSIRTRLGSIADARAAALVIRFDSDSMGGSALRAALALRVGSIAAALVIRFDSDSIWIRFRFD